MRAAMLLTKENVLWTVGSSSRGLDENLILREMGCEQPRHRERLRLILKGLLAKNHIVYREQRYHLCERQVVSTEVEQAVDRYRELLEKVGDDPRDPALVDLYNKNKDNADFRAKVSVLVRVRQATKQEREAASL